MKTVAGYVRRSHAGEAVISERVQRDAIARLAESRELTVGQVFMDWGRTGRLPDDVDGDRLEDILAHRPRALEIMRHIENGSIGAVLAYRQDRLARDSFTLHLMMRRARRHGVPLIIPRGDITAREQRLLTAVEGGMDEEEGTRAKERSDAAEKTMGERKDERGAAPYGWSRKAEPDGRIVKVLTDPDKPGRIVALYRELGSYNAAARRLNDDHVPPPNPNQRRNSAGPPMWSAATVRDIVQREAPRLAKRVSARPRTKRAFRLRGLLVCHCGAPMTVSGNLRGAQYYCNRGKRGAHSPYSISERKVIPWIEAEAAKLGLPSEVELDGETVDDSADVAAIAALVAAGRDDMADSLQADLDAKRTEYGDRARIVQAVPPALDWEWSTENVNEWLRAAFEYIELGSDLLPVRAEWRVPEWRA